MTEPLVGWGWGAICFFPWQKDRGGTQRPTSDLTAIIETRVPYLGLDSSQSKFPRLISFHPSDKPLRLVVTIPSLQI